MFLLLALNIFHTFFYCFYCRLWTRKCKLLMVCIIRWTLRTSFRILMITKTYENIKHMRYLCETFPFTMIKTIISEKRIKEIIWCLWFKFGYWFDFYLWCWWHIDKGNCLTDFYSWRTRWWAYQTEAWVKQIPWWTIFYFESNYLKY